MNNEQKQPFLTVITRHLPQRAELLKRNRKSIEAQTDPDYEQIVLTDSVPGGGGWGYARQMLIDGSMRARGQYVLVLDDDDMMRAIDGIAWLKGAVNPTPSPSPSKKASMERGVPVVIFRGWHGVELGQLPRTNWQQAPVKGDIGCFDFILRRDVFRECVYARGSSDYAHDFDIIGAAYAKYESDVVWLDQMICAADKRRLGK